MPKRFTDTAKWKKEFIKGLSMKCKLLWFYILDDCDHAGIWEVDLEIAGKRIGEEIEYEEAFVSMGSQITVISKNRWWINDFIFFQYGENFTPKNKMYAPVMAILSKYGIDPFNKKMGDISPINGVKVKDKDKVEVKEEVKVKDSDEEILRTYADWTSQIIDGNDQFFEAMFMNEGIPPSDNIQHWILDHRDLLNRYPKMRPPTQDAFRKSCIKHIRENFKKPINGTGANGTRKTGVTAEGTRDRLNSYT